MSAELLLRDRIEYGDDAVAHVTVWRVPKPVIGSSHNDKYSMAYVVNDECVLRYDNEAGNALRLHRAGAAFGRFHHRHQEVE